MANRVVSMLTDRQAKKTIAVGGVKGLTLRVRATGSGISKFFAMRMIVDGKEVIQTIGQYPQVSLESARKIGLEWREKILAGRRPREEAIMERKAKLLEEKAIKHYTVQRMLIDYCDFGEDRLWRNDEIKGQKISKSHSEIVNGYMRNHIPESILFMQAADLTPEILAAAFRQKWMLMIDTPERVIGEIKRAFDFAIRSGKIQPCVNPADLKGRLRDLLPADSMRAQKSHQPALPAERIPELFAELQKHPSITSRLIEFTILTTSRSSNARLTLWSEIFLDQKEHPQAPIQITKRDEMKVKRVKKFDRETPLSDQAVKLLKALPRFMVSEGFDFVFAKASVDAEPTGGGIDDFTVRNNSGGATSINYLGAQVIPNKRRIENK